MARGTVTIREADVQARRAVRPAAVLSPVHRAQVGGGTAAWADLDIGGARHHLAYRVEGADLADACEPFVLASVVPAMASGAAVVAAVPVSPALLSGIQRAQLALSAWYEHLHAVPVEAPARHEPVAGGEGVGCFFSGGVDSFYTVLRHQQEITHLVFVCGFDLGLRDVALRERVVGALSAAAAELGKPLVVVETNLRNFADRHVRWSEEYHGSALASVAHLLNPMLRKMYVPATFSYAMLDPWGSHPLLDPLWSAEGLEIVHDGFETERVDKAALIAESDTALRWLRVCWENRDGSYNCGRCEKCLRTMANLRVAGALNRSAAFPTPLDLEAVATVVLPDSCSREFFRQSLRALHRTDTDPALARALQRALDRRKPTTRLPLMGSALRALRWGRRPHTSVDDVLIRFQFENGTLPWS